MNILHVSSCGDSTPCGIADYTRSLIDSLKGTEVTQEIFTLPVSTNFQHSKKKSERIYSQIIEKSAQFDIVHIQHEFGFFPTKRTCALSLIDFFKFLKKLKSKKVFITFHTDPLYDEKQPVTRRSKIPSLINKLKTWLQRAAVRRLCAKMARSERDKYNIIVHNFILEGSALALGFPHRNIQKLFLPVKIIESKEHSIYFRDCLSKLKNADDILIGIVGFIDAYKGVLELFDALEILPQKYKLVLCGGQHLRNNGSFLDLAMKKILSSPALIDRVFVTGYLEEKYLHHFFDAIDIFAYPYHGGFTSSSGAIGLACQAKKPIVASKTQAFSEIAGSYKCFELISCQAAHELAFAIERVTLDLEKSEALVKNCKNFVAENSWEAASRKFLNYYSAKN